MAGGELANGFDALLVAEGVLRHGVAPALDGDEGGFGGDAHEVGEFGLDGGDERIVGFVDMGTAEEAAEDGLIGGDAVVKLRADPGAGDEFAAFDFWDEEAEAVEGVAEGFPVVTEGDGH